MKKDPDYLARNHMEMNGSSIRQLPGPWNSLGRFKFMFPNPHNIYMHDTPARALFARADRTGSHGCIRLEKPAELAALLLGPQGWTPERIRGGRRLRRTDRRDVDNADPRLHLLCHRVPGTRWTHAFPA